MRVKRLLCSFLLFAVACSPAPDGRDAPPPDAVIFEGARLITGDGGAPIERSAFVVADGRFQRVGRQGDLERIPGAVVIDLAGKTVMPALVELHAHLGYWNGPQQTNVVENFTRENVLDQLQRFAYHGVGVVLSLGTDRRDLA